MRKNGLIIGYVVLVCAIFTYANFAQKLEQAKGRFMVTADVH